MKGRLLTVVIGMLVLASAAHSQERLKLEPSMSWNDIIMMDPKDVDPTDLPLTSVTALHSTGAPQLVDIVRWRLTVSGRGMAAPLSLSLEELSRLPTVKKRVILICPGFFYDYVEWEGVPLSALLQKADAGSDYRTMSFVSVDGYSSSFTREEAASHLLLVATKANGVPLPSEHGFPARLVAEDVFGGRWVKYLAEIRLQ